MFVLKGAMLQTGGQLTETRGFLVEYMFVPIKVNQKVFSISFYHRYPV